MYNDIRIAGLHMECLSILILLGRKKPIITIILGGVIQ